MVADDATGSGDRSEGERDTDLKAPASEESGGQEDGDVEMAVCASEGVSTSEGPAPEEARKWKCAVLFLCIYGFMASIKPGEPFITPNLLSSEKNFTREQVSVE